MTFLRQGKTNWKYILIVVILAIIIVGGALWFSVEIEQPYQPPEIKKSEKVSFEQLSNCNTDSDCILVTHKSCGGTIKISINKKYESLYSSTPEFQDSTGELCKILGISYDEKKQIVEGQVPTESLCVSNTCAPKYSENETANWKTYRNEEYGFEIKHPQDFNIQESGPSVSFCGIESGGSCAIGGAAYHSEVYLFKFKKTGPKEDLYNFVFGSGKLPGDYWPFGKNPNTTNCQVIPITVNEASGKLWDCEYGTGYGELEAFWERQKDDSFYIMSMSLNDRLPYLRNTFKQLLSTFRFLE